MLSEAIWSVMLTSAIVPFADILQIRYTVDAENNATLSIDRKNESCTKITFEDFAEFKEHVKRLLTDAKKYHAEKMRFLPYSEETEGQRYKIMQCIVLLNDFFND